MTSEVNLNTCNGLSEFVGSPNTGWIKYEGSSKHDWIRVKIVTPSISLKLDTGQEGDSVEFRNANVKIVIINTVAGIDQILVANSTIHGSFYCTTGKGEDRIGIRFSRLMGQSIIADNSGKSAVALDHATFSDVGIYLSPQNDSIWNTESRSMNQSLVIDAGEGGDLYYVRNFTIRGVLPQIDLGLRNNQVKQI